MLDDFLPMTYLTPGTSFKHTFTRASQGLTPIEQSIALVGMQSLDAATSGEPMLVRSADEGAARFGEGCELALMLDTAFAVGALFGQMPKVYAVPLAPPAGDAGKAAETTLAITGTVSQSGRVELRIAGVRVVIPANVGDSNVDIASAMRAAITAASRHMPVTSGGTGANVLAKHRTTGVHGNDVMFEIVDLPIGIDITVSRTKDGTGETGIAQALDNLLALDVNGIAIANHTSADVEDLVEHTEHAWQPQRKRWRHVFVGTNGDASEAGMLAAIDRFAVIVGACAKSPSSPGQIAAALATITFATGSPNYNLTGYNMLPLFAPRASYRYTPLDIEELLHLGVTPLEAVPNRGNRLKIARLVTTQRTVAGVPSHQLIDASVSLTSAYMSRQLDLAYTRSFGPESGDPRRITAALLEQIRDVIIATLRAGERAGYVRDLDKRLHEIKVTESETRGRLLVSVPLEPTPQLMQLAFSINTYS